MYLKRIFPNYFAHRAILLGLRKKGDISEARKYFDTLTTMTEDIVLYNIMMDGYVNLGNINGMLELLREMKEKAVHPTHVTGTVVIKGLCQQGKLQEAVQVIEEILCKRTLTTEAKYFFSMMLSDGISPDQELCKVMLNAFRRGGDSSSVFQLLAEMIKSGFPPD
ncbi:hypothetical protein M0R45_022033 [Rubus argutus]|uniref:Pentatricopeptide repeat-containing protein n=1 Tax=Rubus argutus TaxID=59490 RepID=A0AAW1XD77_RUBAR